MFHAFFAASALVLCTPAFAGDLVSTLDSLSGNPLPANIPSARVIAELAARFDQARAPLSDGDLHLESRWMCREFFTVTDGLSTYRFKTIQLKTYEGGILEDALNTSPRFYIHGHDGLFGESSRRGGVVTEARVDERGNLRLVERDGAGAARSYTVCLAKNRSVR